MKTQPKQVLGSLPLAFVLPDLAHACTEELFTKEVTIAITVLQGIHKQEIIKFTVKIQSLGSLQTRNVSTEVRLN